jgi:hypothetical protein
VSKSPRIQRWRWTIEEFGPTIGYIKGPHNVVADALSRLDTEVSSTTASSKQMSELYENMDDKSLQDLDLLEIYPLRSFKFRIFICLGYPLGIFIFDEMRVSANRSVIN